jgi:hypothetical protein
MIVIDSTDHKHIGDHVDIINGGIAFHDGEIMAVEKIIEDGDEKVIANSNYQIRVKDK